MEKKNFRATNFSAREENILINLVKKYKNEVECKKSDTDNNKIKAEAWEKIYNEYNSILGDPHRSAKVLKNKYDNIKKRAKQKFADNKKYVIGTGGGPFKDLVITDSGSDLHEILGTQLTGLTSKFDNDATAESIIIQVEDNNNLSENSEYLEETSAKKFRRTSSCVDIYSTQEDSQGAESENRSLTRVQAIHLKPEPRPERSVDSSTFCAPVEAQVSHTEFSANDWATYSPAMLKRPLSAPLLKPNIKDVTLKKNQCRQLSAKLEDWAKCKSRYTEVEEIAFKEKHQLLMKNIQEKHQQEMRIQEKESQTRMKCLEEEHNFKMKILEKKYEACYIKTRLQ